MHWLSSWNFTITFWNKTNFVPCDRNTINVKGKTMIEHCILQLSGRRIYSYSLNLNAFFTFLWIFILTCGSGSDIFLIKILNFLFCFIFHSCWNYKSERNNSGLGQGHWGTTSQCYKLVWMLYKLICCSRIPCDISQNIFCISTTSGNYFWTSNFLRCFKLWKSTFP